MGGRTAVGFFLSLISALGILFWAFPGADASAAEVTSCPGQLLAALKDSSIRTIELVGDCSLAGTADEEHLVIARNVTITAKPGTLPVLDLAFTNELLELCRACWMTIKGVTLTRDRRGSGDGVQAIAGGEQRGAVLLLQDVIRHRIACVPAADAAAVLSETPRSVLVPGGASDAAQQLSLGSIEYKGAVYPDSLLLLDVAVDMELTHMEGRVSHASSGKRGHSGGLTLWQKNVSRVCEHVVSAECLLAKGADACVNDAIDQVQAAQGHAAAETFQPAVIAVAVLVPAVVVGLLAAAAALWLRRRRMRRWQLPASSPLPKDKRQRPMSSSFTSSRASRDGFGARLCQADSATEPTLQRKVSIDVRISQQQPRPPLGGAMAGWEIAGMSTSPFAGEVADMTVEFGELLGSGSFGRVYKARWGGQDVAVKVIEHTESTLNAVEAEASLMLSLNHPNLVRAYHFVTYTQHPQLTSTCSMNSSQCSRMLAAADAATVEAASPPAAAATAGPGWLTSSESVMEKTADPASPAGISIVGQGSSRRASTSIGRQQQGSLGAYSTSSRGSGAGGGIGLERVNTVHTASSGWQCRPAKAETWLVQEFCDRGTLAEVAGAWLPEAECEAQMLQRLQLLLDTAMGLAALHAECVVHGDLNARNVLVASAPGASLGMAAKVADLGLSKVIKHNSHHTTNTVGTMNHTAPELLRYGRMSPAIDVYSFGIMMHQLYTNQVPFARLHYGQFFETVVLQSLRPVVPLSMPRDYQALMAACWAAEPAERPTAQQLVSCLQAMAAERQAHLSGQPASPAAMQSVWQILRLQPPGEADQHPAVAGGSLLGGGSPAASEGSWHGFVQRGGAATSEVVPQPSHQHSSNSMPAAAAAEQQHSTAAQSSAAAADGHRHDDSQNHHGYDDAAHTQSWFV